jgi:aspartyl protease family protein
MMNNQIHTQRVMHTLQQFCGIIVLLSSLGAAAAPVIVNAELERLMLEHGFEVTGIEYTVDAVAHAEGTQLIERLRLLLENFNYVIVQNSAHGVARILILGEKTAVAPPPAAPAPTAAPPTAAADIVLPTQRQGASHLVTLTLEGANNQHIQQPMLIDTGADQIVLPTSLIARLGLNPATLRERPVQTANGSVNARLGRLPAVLLGTERLTNLAVAFIDDQRLGGQALLGMSVLGRFRMTIDDANNQIILAKK